MNKQRNQTKDYHLNHRIPHTRLRPRRQRPTHSRSHMRRRQNLRPRLIRQPTRNLYRPGPHNRLRGSHEHNRRHVHSSRNTHNHHSRTQITTPIHSPGRRHSARSNTRRRHNQRRISPLSRRGTRSLASSPATQATQKTQTTQQNSSPTHPTNQTATPTPTTQEPKYDPTPSQSSQ